MGKKINLWNHQSAFSTLSLNRLLCGHWGCPSHTLYGWLYYITLFHFNQLFFQSFLYFLCFLISILINFYFICFFNFLLMIQKKPFNKAFLSQKNCTVIRFVHLWFKMVVYLPFFLSSLASTSFAILRLLGIERIKRIATKPTQDVSTIEPMFVQFAFWPSSPMPLIL